MKILSSSEIRQWDQYTIEHEPISSIDLMERAARACVEWILEHHPNQSKFSIFCGKGNNGGDGLAIARMLMANNYTVLVFILEFGHKGTEDFQTNLAKLHQVPGHDIHFIQSELNFHPAKKNEIIIDALFGSGLNRKLEGVTAELVNHINNSGCPVISIDIPSGLFVDHSSKENISVHATHTLSFQCYKPAFLFAENEEAVGQLHILDIGLLRTWYERIQNHFELTDPTIIHGIYKPRKAFSHKGNFGHALLVAGSYGKMGAAVLATKACLRSGAGLVTVHIPNAGVGILQTSVPEAMVSPDIFPHENGEVETNLEVFNALGIGPGLGKDGDTKKMIASLLKKFNRPMVIDADALNCIAEDKDLLKLIPAGSVLTPHPKEFERLFGPCNNDFERMLLAVEKAKDLNCIIVLKGHYTCIATGSEKTYFNPTGNPGMATGGSGDVLTGIITGLIAQGYSSVEAAILAVYLHGLSGDLAAKEISMEALVAGDLVEWLGKAFLKISQRI